MRRSAYRFGVFLAAAAVSWALPASAQERSLKVITTSVPSSGAHKECLSISRSQSLRYWFRADGPLDFNIQVKLGDKISYPVRRDKVTMDSGHFAPNEAEVYCMVLTNSATRPVTVRLEFARLNNR
jgi:hypothetical protein